jgi:hypothetical protein
MMATRTRMKMKKVTKKKKMKTAMMKRKEKAMATTMMIMLMTIRATILTPQKGRDTRGLLQAVAVVAVLIRRVQALVEKENRASVLMLKMATSPSYTLRLKIQVFKNNKNH